MKSTLQKAIGLEGDAWLRIDSRSGKIEMNSDEQWQETGWRFNAITGELEVLLGSVYERSGYGYCDKTGVVTSLRDLPVTRGSSWDFQPLRRWLSSKHNWCLLCGLLLVAISFLGFHNHTGNSFPAIPIAMCILAALLATWLVWHRSSIKAALLFILAMAASRAMWLYPLLHSDTPGSAANPSLQVHSNATASTDSSGLSKKLYQKGEMVAVPGESRILEAGQKSRGSGSSSDAVSGEINSKNLINSITMEFSSESGETVWSLDGRELLKSDHPSDGAKNISPGGRSVHFGRMKLNSQFGTVVAFHANKAGEIVSYGSQGLPEKIGRLLENDSRLAGRPSIDRCWVSPVEWIENSKLVVSTYAVSSEASGFQLSDYRCVWDLETNECTYDKRYKSNQEEITYNQSQPTPQAVSPSAPSASSYSGQVGKLDAEWTLTWKENGKVEGSYFYPQRNAQTIYSLSGTNATDGTLTLSEFTNGAKTATLFLSKSIFNGQVIWSGQMHNSDGRILPVSLQKR